MRVHSDEFIEHCADLFRGELVYEFTGVTFQEFLELPSHHRDYVVWAASQQQVRPLLPAQVGVRDRIEDAYEDLAYQLMPAGADVEVRDGRLVEPLHHHPRHPSRRSKRGHVKAARRA
jgi:hypothetical protein